MHETQKLSFEAKSKEAQDILDIISFNFFVSHKS